MLQVTDVRQTRVFQEALEEGREKALLEVAIQLLRLGRPIAEVVKATGFTAAKVRALKKKL